MSRIVSLVSQTGSGLKAWALRPLNRGVVPRYINYLVTLACNLKCPFCNIHEDQRLCGHRNRDLTVPEIRRAFADPLLAKVAVIRISGGEPFLREDLGEVLVQLHRSVHPELIHITTNGSLPDAIARAVEQAASGGARLHLQVSLDAAGKLLDSIRGLPGLFDRCLESLQTLASLQRRLGFYVGINQTVTSHNIDAIAPVQALARKFGFGYKFTAATRYNELTSVDHDPLESPLPFAFHDSLRHKDWPLIFAAYAALQRDRSSFSRSHWNSRLWKYTEGILFEGQRHRLVRQNNRPNIMCTALFTHFRLLPDGTVVACNPLLTKPLGSLRDASFSSLWQGKPAQCLRRQVRACKGCWLECDLAPSIFYSLQIVPLMMRRWLLS